MSYSAEPGRKAAYSVDIGWRVVWQYMGMNHRFKDIGKRLQIAPSTAHRIFTRFKTTGDVAPSKQPLRPQHRKLDNHHELLIMGIVLANPSSYLREICYTVKEATGVEVSGSTVCRVLKRNFHKETCKQRSIEYRAQFVARAMFYDRDTFVWFDETGSDRRKSMRKFGYSLRGFPPVCHRLLARGKRISAIAAICSEGILGVELTTGTVDGDKFVDFIRGTLIPNMHAYDGTSSKSVVVMDNCAIHHIPEVLELLKDAGILCLFLPPYSPD